MASTKDGGSVLPRACFIANSRQLPVSQALCMLPLLRTVVSQGHRAQTEEWTPGNALLLFTGQRRGGEEAGGKKHPREEAKKTLFLVAC